VKRFDVDIAVIGASLGGVLAAWRACEAGRRVLLTSEFDWIGGQLTAQGVPPDEHRLIEYGGASESYLAFRRAMRSLYLANPNYVDNTEMTEGVNPGDGWVTRLCIEPIHALHYLQALLAPHIASGRLTMLTGTRLDSAVRVGRTIESVIVTNAADEKVAIAARYFLDAADTGALIAAAKLPYRLGKEAHAEFGERDAPLEANRLDQQPCTMVVALALGHSPRPPTTRPAAYDFWCNYQVPHYGYRLFSHFIPGPAMGKSVTLPFFGSGQTLDLWRYRRVMSARNWRMPVEEVSLINWAQNDYALSPLLEGPVAEGDVVMAARELTSSLVHWLQTDAPHDDGNEGKQDSRLAGFAELFVSPETLASPAAFPGQAQQVYVRESRRIVGLDCLTQTDILADASTGGISEPFHAVNSVGVAWYNMDIHPTCVSGHGVNAKVRPFTLPLGCFIPQDCDNLIPACKNISVTHLVNASTRTHPTEWLIGEVAALLADFALRSNHPLVDIHRSATLVTDFQQELIAAGIPVRWDASLTDRLRTVAVNSMEI